MSYKALVRLAARAVLANNNVDALAIYDKAGFFPPEEIEANILLAALRTEHILADYGDEELQPLAINSPWLMAFYAAYLFRRGEHVKSAKALQACKSGMGKYFDRLRKMLTQHARKGKRIVVGPWTGEVGFEILYWMPFCRALLNSDELRQACVVVTRGGIGAYYWEGAVEYDYFSDPAIDLQASQKEREKLFRSQKQLAEIKGEWGLLTGMGVDAIEDVQLHPKHMFLLFSPFFNRYTSQLFIHGALVPYVRPVDLRLSGQDRSSVEDYAYLDVYQRPSFKPDASTLPDLQHKITAWSGLMGNCSYKSVELERGVDEHTAFKLNDIVSVQVEKVPIVGNLRQKIETIRHARHAVMTYGGLSYIANAAGVPVLTVRTTNRYIMNEHEAMATLLYPYSKRLHVSVSGAAEANE